MLSCLQGGAIPAVITNSPVHSLLVYYIQQYGYDGQSYSIGKLYSVHLSAVMSESIKMIEAVYTRECLDFLLKA